MRKRHSISHIESGMTHIDAFIRYIRNYANQPTTMTDLEGMAGFLSSFLSG